MTWHPDPIGEHRGAITIVLALLIGLAVYFGVLFGGIWDCC